MQHYKFLNYIVLWNVFFAIICIPTAAKLIFHDRRYSHDRRHPVFSACKTKSVRLKALLLNKSPLYRDWYIRRNISSALVDRDQRGGANQV
jgi:hypothetical protein